MLSLFKRDRYRRLDAALHHPRLKPMAGRESYVRSNRTKGNAQLTLGVAIVGCILLFTNVSFVKDLDTQVFAPTYILIIAALVGVLLWAWFSRHILDADGKPLWTSGRMLEDVLSFLEIPLEEFMEPRRYGAHTYNVWVASFDDALTAIEERLAELDAHEL